MSAPLLVKSRAWCPGNCLRKARAPPRLPSVHPRGLLSAQEGADLCPLASGGAGTRPARAATSTPGPGPGPAVSGPKAATSSNAHEAWTVKCPWPGAGGALTGGALQVPRGSQAFGHRRAGQFGHELTCSQVLSVSLASGDDCEADFHSLQRGGVLRCTASYPRVCLCDVSPRRTQLRARTQAAPTPRAAVV